MICPWCEIENIAGADTCEGCGNDLTALDANGHGSDLGKSVARTPVSQVQTPPTIVVPPETPLGEVVRRLVDGNVGCVLVVSQGGLVGILSERDLLMKVGPDFDQLESRPVSAFMTPDPETLAPQATIAFALNRMDVGGFRHIPIVQEGRPQSVVSVRDLLGYLSDRQHLNDEWAA